MSKVKLNLGCGPARFDQGWINVDLVSPSLEQHELINVRANLLAGLPFRDASAAVIYTSHFLEHLGPFEECDRFLRECLRVLSPGGLLRVSVPDFRKIALIYLSDPKEFYAEYDYKKPWFDKASSWSRRLGISVMYDHRMLYDLTSLSEVLENVGFRDLQSIAEGVGGHLPAEVSAEIIPTHLSHSLIVDGRRPV